MSISTTQKERKLLFCKNVRAKFKRRNGKYFVTILLTKRRPKNISERQKE